ncbi:F-box/LRR-repeat protein [Trifolium pratense]|uniref:F-box/LRR-repeat protein n=1 Tax=Trifolium pratense TaxID=57577 RepID=A0A2K3MRU6_TRIPR|nr:F-box/LRR-repeat protein [Trifolium pratense]PNY10865.1 F-box/LRR-repeat protein [Trifolium pratense]PNY12912.1 F-box/LRR-repeat protein [Trifolium pratense]
MSRSIPTEDRISSLPDPILHHILSFLPTKLAATTSILSKRWNPQWLSVPVLEENIEWAKVLCVQQPDLMHWKSNYQFPIYHNLIYIKLILKKNNPEKWNWL